MLNFSLILIAAMVAVGLTEMVKNFLPETVDARITTAIALLISVVISVAVCMYQGLAIEAIFMNTLVVVGLAQTSYNYVLRLLNKYMDLVTEKILEKSLENEWQMETFDDSVTEAKKNNEGTS